MPSVIADDGKKLGACTFFARVYPSESCGSNGLPLTPKSINILGQAQKLKTIDHPNLCIYLDVIRGKHERIIVVSEYSGKPLADVCSALNLQQKINIMQQIAKGLQHSHSLKITHRNICMDNILVDSQLNVKLFNYGLYYMTAEGDDVSFPIGLPQYLSPEVILGGGGPRSDVWSFGMLVLELFLGPLWSALRAGPVLRRVMSLQQAANPAQRIAREHDALDNYLELPEDLRKVIESCLSISPRVRPAFDDIVRSPLFPAPRVIIAPQKAGPGGLLACSMQLLYSWWQLAGGDIQAELRKQGLIKNSPPILSLPIAVLLEGSWLGGRGPALMDSRVATCDLALLATRLGHLPPPDYFPLINSPPSPHSETSSLPRIIRERDTEYQFHRLILFERLLKGYPSTAARIQAEAALDIPPLLRGRVWAALLQVQGDVEEQYTRIDKETPTATDRQIEVDIPRCHQYCWLLSGQAGHASLRRILKAWLLTNPPYVYWQGLDSLSAPFLFLNFNDEARAFACLSAFVPKYLNNFFLKDNSAVIKEYLAKFWQLTAFHEPKLASHLHEIHFIPELFAIPWFLTMFSHVFPLHKILHLWDALLVADGSLPLYMGVAILRQLRDTLLAAGFNECILLFSDLPEVDIEQCVTKSIVMHKISPKSISYRSFDKDMGRSEGMDSVHIDAPTLQKEVCPRISCNDLLQLLDEKRACVIDIRPNLQFNRLNIPDSINVPYSSVHLGEHSLPGLGPLIAADITSAVRNKHVVVVVSTEIETAQLFGEYLVRCEVSHVCLLHGGMQVLHSVSPPVLQHYN